MDFIVYSSLKPPLARDAIINDALRENKSIENIGLNRLDFLMLKKRVREEYYCITSLIALTRNYDETSSSWPKD